MLEFNIPPLLFTELAFPNGELLDIDGLFPNGFELPLGTPAPNGLAILEGPDAEATGAVEVEVANEDCPNPELPNPDCPKLELPKAEAVGAEVEVFAGETDAPNGLAVFGLEDENGDAPKGFEIAVDSNPEDPNPPAGVLPNPVWPRVEDVLPNVLLLIPLALEVVLRVANGEELRL